MGFKDSNPTLEIMTKTALLWSSFFLPYWVMNQPVFFQYNSASSGHLKACQTNNNLEQSRMIYIWKRSKWQQINWMRICRTSNPIPGIASKIFCLCIFHFITNFNIEILIDGIKFSLTSVEKIQGDPLLNTAKKI